MPARLGVEHWRDRAEETLQLVELMTDEDSKWRVRRIAADYEKLAQRADATNGASDPRRLEEPSRLLDSSSTPR
jgi:hypothetical protein